MPTHLPAIPPLLASGNTDDLPAVIAALDRHTKALAAATQALYAHTEALHRAQESTGRVR